MQTLKTDPELLDRLIESARAHKPSPFHSLEQRVSFIYGQMMTSNPGVSKDWIRRRILDGWFG